MKIGFIGTGQMGFPMATNLMIRKHELKVYNRTTEKAIPLYEKGAEKAKSPAEAAQGVDLLITMLSDDKALIDMVENEEVMKNLGQDGLHISCSTIHPNTARKLATHHASYGVHYLASPVFGTPDTITARKSNVVVSGKEADIERARQVLEDAMAAKVWNFGTEIGAANTVKIAGNFMIAGCIELMAEMFAFTGKNGIEASKCADLYFSTLFDAPVFHNYGKKIMDESLRDPASFRLALGLKDLNLILDTARENAIPMPVAQTIQQLFLTAVARGKSDKDWSALSEVAYENAGLSQLV